MGRDLTSRLRERVQREPERRAYTFLADGEEEQGSLTYAGLDERARAIAAALQERCRPGDRALLLCPPGLDFVTAFFGCLYAGVVAVPAYPPRSARALPRLRSILEDSRPAVVLAPAASAARIRSWLERSPDLPALPWVDTSETGSAEAWRQPALRGEDLAFLQYTSGSTSAPKGVMVSHANLAHNQEVIRQACDHTAESVFVSWLPLYHDLGLIGNLLQAVWVGAPCVLMAPVAFLQSPVRWLRAVSRYRGTTSGGPNSAYELCVRKVSPAEEEDLDLSSWRVAFNGAEPVRAGTLERFAAAFAPAGFRRQALYPCYGLAEATLMVSGNWPDEGPAVRGSAVGCGRALSGLEVVIADPETRQVCAPEKTGEIWVAGESVARGYWNRPEETAETFGARLADGRGPFLRTGDLGFLDGEQLVVAGRLKDLVILRGRNHYPQDLELTAERSHPALRPGGGAAFAVEAAGEERLVLVHEVERHGGAAVEEIAAAVRAAVAAEHEAVVFEVVLVPPGGVPRTTSGKVQRRACRDLWRAGSLTALGRSALSAEAAAEAPLEAGALREALAATPEGEREALVEGWLRRTFARLARVDADGIAPDRPLGAYGLDSLVAVELRNAVEVEVGAELSIAELLGGMTLREAARGLTQDLRQSPPNVETPHGASLHWGADACLSWNQRSLWVLHRLAPESVAYHIAGAARLPEGADPARLRRALQTLVDRHAILRTTYLDGPVQRIAEHAEVAFLCEDASQRSEDELRRRLHEEAFRPFDLERGPVFRASLFTRGPEAWLVLAVHHIAADLWSLAILVRELGIAYAGGDLPAAEATYLDYVRWQEEMLAGPRGERLAEHWLQRLAGAPFLDLPTDRPRPAVQGFRGVTRTLHLDSGQASALARERGCTLFVVLLTGFQALLSRYTGQQDLLIGSPANGRGSVRWAEVAGYFADLVALRADLTSIPTGDELLARTRREALDAFEHQDYPFALLAERHPGRPPLLQAVLSLEKAPAPELAGLAAFALGEPGARLSLNGLELESVVLQSPGAQRDLTLLAAELDGHLVLSLQADADLFDGATAERMLGHLAGLLSALTATPGRPVAELEMLSTAERRQLLSDWSGASPAYPREEPIHRLFEETARHAPERPALACQDLEVTYAELNERADRLARHLRSLGVVPETPVGVALDRSPEMVASYLGVLKAGGAYVPLDPGYPKERLAALLDEVPLPLILTEERLLGRLPPCAGRVVCLDRLGGEIKTDLDVPVSARNLAYVMFTSGSTGRPKAVGVEHRSVVRLVRGADWADLGAEQVFLQLAPASFDAATLEIWGPLLNGGRLALLPGGAPSLAELEEALEKHGVTTLWLTAGLFHQVVEDRIESLRGLSQLLAGGDVLSPSHVERALAGLPGCRLINGYGPTENTTFTCCHTIREPVGAAVPIGRPVANTRVYVLDGGLQPIPVGVPGELFAGGDGLARGYLSRPELTAELFIPDPFGDPTDRTDRSDRLYRTGDRVRWRPDGAIEFLGRLDQQVKIRGFRVEPGEVEAVLARHPAVRQAAVTVAGRSAADKRLVAWVALREGGPGNAGVPPALRAFLRERLPEPMVPAAVVVLPGLPLSPNGKVDRRALAALPAPEREAGTYAVPRTPTEELLAGFWADLLGLERVGIHDSFFDLGGHSLLATRLVARLREPFGVELPLRDLFEHPTIAGLAARIETVRGSASGVPPLRRTEPGAAAPLSFAQERLWFLDRLTPGSAVYNVSGALRLRGSLSVPALAAALDGVACRQEALRTVFPAAGDGPVQSVLPAVPFPLEQVDLTREPDPASAALERAVVEARRPFDLERGPLARAVLFQLGPEDHLLLLSLHHIAADGWSLRVLLREIEAGYGPAQEVPEPPVRYADFAAWERELLAGERLDAQLAWWRDALAGAPTVLDLPTDRPRPPARASRGTAVPVALPADLIAALDGLARREGATLFMVLLAGFAALLGRSSREEDLVVGAPVARRDRPEAEGLIGFFVNTLPLRVRLDGDPSGRELLCRVRAMALGAYEHQHVPFERLVEEVQPRRDLARTPLFQVLLAVEDAPREPLRLPGIEASLVPVHTGTAKFDLTLSLAREGGGLAGEIEIDAGLFDSATAERLAAHFSRLLQGLAERPERRIADLPLLGEAEQQALLAEGRGAARPVPEQCLHELIAARAAGAADSVALSWEGGSLTYGELAARAGRLARHLRRLGIGPEVVVGLFAERSPELIVGILGVLEAGGAYLPLDPDWPRERLRLLLEDAAAPVLLAQRHLAEELPAGGAALLLLEEPGEPGSPLQKTAGPDNLAYVIYTSGSTGRPKGVAVPHRGVVNRIVSAIEAFEITPEDVMILRASIGFDASVWEIFAPLVAGSRLTLPRPGGHRDPVYLSGFVADQAVTLYPVSPSALDAFLRQDGLEERTRALRWVFAGAESVPRELIERFFARVGCRLENMYGPTEASIDLLWYSCRPGDPRAAAPIGRPIPNCAAHVLDPELSLAPVGLPGELWLTGACLVRGYLGRPDLTAERFVPSLFGGAGERMYRSGDLARVLADGHQIEFLGRADHQVKIRGVRIEPAEVEHALLRHPGVREAAVVARESGREPGDRLLVAYVSAAGGTGPDPRELRSWLAASLPAAMVPSRFVVLPALPRMPNGKLDRRGLPDPGSLAAEAAPGTPPRTPLEELIAGLWDDLLGCEGVGTEESFFDLGGHSLLATRLVSRLHRATGVELPVAAVFASPTVAGLAAAVECASGERAEVPPLVRPPRDGAVPLSFAQERLWLLEQLAGESPAYNVPLAVRLRGPVAPAVLSGVLDKIVRRHEALRTTFAEVDGRPVQVIAPAGGWALSLVDLGGLAPERRQAEADRRVREEAARPFDLAAGPLARAVLLRLAAGESLLVLNLHHIVADGWSVGVLLREVSELAAGRALPEPPVQYADFAIWQRRWLEDGALEAQLAAWRERLAGAPAALDVPADRPRPAVRSSRGGAEPVELPAELVRGLRALARREGATLFLVLLGGLAALLHRYTGEDDLVVGTPVANRRLPEVEPLVGFFANTLPLRAEMGGDPTFFTFLGRLRSTALAAWDHQDIPFERLVEEMAVERDLSRNPLFQVMLALEDGPGAELRLPGVEATLLPVHNGTAKLDLLLALSQEPEGLRGGLEYSADLFDAATVRRLADHLTNLLDGLVRTGSQARLGDLPLLGAAEARQALDEAGSLASAPQGTGLHQLFEAQAARTPGATALVAGTERLTYRELDARADALAGRLRRLGLPPESLVGVFSSRTAGLVVSLLAVLKAGGAYLPLDPGYPAERLAFLLADSNAPVVLAERRLAPSLPAFGGTVVFLDDPVSADGPPESVGVDPDRIAYAIYTSGSTGAPKGVLIRHGSAVARVAWALAAYAPEVLAGVLASTSVCFDLSVFEIFVPLAAGGAVILAGDALALPELPEGERVTLVNTVPSALAELVRAHALPSSVRVVNLAGEPLRRDLADRIYEQPGVEEVWDLYGPSEDTTYSTGARVERGASRQPTIGRPLPGTRACLLDAHGQPVPRSVPGELWIGGAGLARGYLGRPELTADRFRPDPLGEVPGSRLYRTGDLARRRPDGELDFLGRLDHQVKVRGFRIEPGEIEAALRACPGVREAAVLKTGERLVAFVVAESSSSLATDLRRQLGERLPAFSLPAVFVPLPALPLTPNGKVDRKALERQAATGLQSGAAAEPVAPRNPLEEILAEIWAELLEVESVGVHDDFFALGGHSLLGVRLTARVRDLCGVQLPLRAVFQAPTVAGLAEVLEDAMAIQAGEDLLEQMFSDAGEPREVLYG